MKLYLLVDTLIDSHVIKAMSKNLTVESKVQTHGVKMKGITANTGLRIWAVNKKDGNCRESQYKK